MNLSHEQDVESGSRISTLGIVTADRPQAVERCLGSYIGHFQTHGRSPHIVVVDDSRRAANATATKRIADRARSTYAGVIQYIGAREKAEAQRVLTRAGLPPASIDFGLPTRGRGFAPGANRNHLLLATAGELLLTADDDTVCRTWSAEDAPQGVAFAGYADPRQFRFFASRRQALKAATWNDIDLLSAHEAMLGHPLASVASRSNTTDVSEACDHVRVGLASKDTNYRVRITSTGVAGDGAMYSPYRLLFSPSTLHRWATIDERAFKTALRSREMLRIAPRATVTHQSAAMSYSLGLDNRTLMPPFNPSGANEDGLFGVMLRLTVPMTFLAHVPVGIVHDSRRGAAYTGQRMLCASQTRLAEMIHALLHEWAMAKAAPLTPRRRLRSLGQHLTALSELPIDDFALHAVTASLDLWERERAHLDAAIVSTPEFPPFWRRALEKYRKTLFSNAIEPVFFVPIELKRSEPVRLGFRRLQVYLGSLGDLMRAWPEMWDVARREGVYRPT